MSKKLKVLASVAIAAVALMSVVSCAGPAGPAGSTGPQGTSVPQSLPSVNDVVTLGGVQNWNFANITDFAKNAGLFVGEYSGNSSGNATTSGTLDQNYDNLAIITDGGAKALQVSPAFDGSGRGFYAKKLFTGFTTAGVYQVATKLKILTTGTTGNAIELQYVPTQSLVAFSTALDDVNDPSANLATYGSDQLYPNPTTPDTSFTTHYAYVTFPSGYDNLKIAAWADRVGNTYEIQSISVKAFPFTLLNVAGGSVNQSFTGFTNADLPGVTGFNGFLTSGGSPSYTLDGTGLALNIPANAASSNNNVGFYGAVLPLGSPSPVLIGGTYTVTITIAAGATAPDSPLIQLTDSAGTNFKQQPVTNASAQTLTFTGLKLNEGATIGFYVDTQVQSTGDTFKITGITYNRTGN